MGVDSEPTSLRLFCLADAKYCLHYAKAFFTDCVQNGIAARTHQQFVMRRLYARGEQGVGKYNYKFSEGGTYNSVTINDMRARVLATMPRQYQVN